MGEILEWLLYAGVSRGEVHQAMEFLGIDDPGWFLSWAALVEDRPAASHLFTIAGSPDPHQAFTGGGNRADRLTRGRRALADAGLSAGVDAKSIEPDGYEVAPPSLSESAEWVFDVWTEFGELREDGLQRIDEARDSGVGETGLVRDALGVLHSACLLGEQALESHRTAVERPRFAISRGAALMSDCYRDAAYTAGWLGDLDEALRLAERSATLGKASLDVETRAKSQQTLGHLLTRRGHRTDARRALECFLEAETYYRASGADDSKILRSASMKVLAFNGRNDPSVLRNGPEIDLPGSRRGRSRPRQAAHEPWRMPRREE